MTDKSRSIAVSVAAPGGQLKVSGDATGPSHRTGGGDTAGCHLRSGHPSPCNRHTTVAMETNGGEARLRAARDVMSVVTWPLSLSLSLLLCVDSCC